MPHWHGTCRGPWRGLAYRPLEPMLSDISEAVERLSARRGLSARFEWNVGSGGLDAGTLETLVEIPSGSSSEILCAME